MNTAAIHYHFGSKPELVRAILGRRIEPLNAERARLLEEELERSAGERIPAEVLLRAFLLPMASDPHAIGDEMRRVHALFAWLHSEGERLPLSMQHHLEPIKLRFAEALARGRDLSVDEANERIGYAMGAMVQLMSHASGIVEAEPWAPEEFERRRERLFHFLAAGLDAPAHRTNQGRASADAQPAEPAPKAMNA